MNSYYIGIDGGATSTVVCLGDSKENIVDTIKLTASNYHTVGIEKAKQVFKDALKTISDRHGVSLDSIKGICFGGAGMDSEEGIKIITNVFRELGYKNELTVCNDGLIALIGANDGYRGGVLIGGTGSVAIGVGKDRKLHKVGGWGHILDDGGSGYAIGRDALSSIMKSYDGRGEGTLLWEKAKQHFEIEKQEQITNFVYNPDTKKHDIAAVAPMVIDLYKKDEVATRIIDKAISDLEILIITLAKNIEKNSFSLGLYGSIIVKSDKLRERLIEKVHQTCPNIDIHLPYKEAYIGALYIAIGKVKID